MYMTHYFVLRLVQTSDGKLVAAEREEKLSGMAAVTSACAYATEKGGAIAFSRQGELAPAGSEPLRVIAGLGLLPADLELFMQSLAG
jgi:hypothetical protein